MSKETGAEAAIIESWHANAEAWAEAVRKGQLESRRLCTDEAIVSAVLSRAPHSVIDIGCGEGWLARVLGSRGIRVLGLDAVPNLIERARAGGGGTFQVMAYEAIAEGKLEASADAVVCNFSLLGEQSVEGIFSAVPQLLNPGGVFIVQTVHAATVCGDGPCADGWKEGLWAGFSTDFTAQAPWYFRTLQSWIRLFEGSGFQLSEVREPVHPISKKPLSLLMVAEKANTPPAPRTV